jgi:hypothetical protein
LRRTDVLRDCFTLPRLPLPAYRIAEIAKELAINVSLDR